MTSLPVKPVRLQRDNPCGPPGDPFEHRTRKGRRRHSRGHRGPDRQWRVDPGSNGRPVTGRTRARAEHRTDLAHLVRDLDQPVAVEGILPRSRQGGGDVGQTRRFKPEYSGTQQPRWTSSADM